MLSYEQYPEEKSRLWSSSFKKIDQPSWRTTRRNYKHIPQIVCIYLGEGLLYLESGNLPHYNLPDVNLLNDFNEVAVKQMVNCLKRILNSEVRLQKILVRMNKD